MKIKITLTFLLFTCLLWAQETKNVFFIGNSYTGTGNIPELIKQVANSAGDVLLYQAHTPGGSTLQQHASNPSVNATIDQGNWDYVVLQEQSQLPSFPQNQINNQIAPYAAQLSNRIKQSNPCTQVTFYMTWGRKNGDQDNCPGWPPVCTYIGMDDLIRQTYMNLAAANDGIVSPVGAVWRYLITNYPNLDLYSSDQSHPSTFGSMAAAYTFYTVFFKKSPYDASFSSNIPATSLAAIQEAVENIVFNQMDTWHLLDQTPTAAFNYAEEDGTVSFTNNSDNAEEYHWDFGDGNTDTTENPTHTYIENGTYTVHLTVTKCGESNTTEQTITISTLSIQDLDVASLSIYPNPATDRVFLNTEQPIKSIQIIDALGRTIKANYTQNSTILSIDTHNLSTGSYFLEVEINSQKHQIRFIKK